MAIWYVVNPDGFAENQLELGADEVEEFRATLPGGYSLTDVAPPPPPAPVPEQSPKWRVLVALRDAGQLQAAREWAATLDVESNSALWWDDAAVWQRSGGEVALMAASLGLADAQLDDLFRAAGSI